MTTLQPLSVLVQHSAPISRIAVDFSETRLVTADGERQVAFWRKSGEAWIKTVELNFRHTNDKYRALDHVRSLEFSPNGARIYIASGESTFCYDFDSGQLLGEHDSKPLFAFLINTVQDIAVRRDGVVAMTGSDGTVDILDENLHPIRRFKDREGPVMIGFNAGGELVGSDYYHLIKWDPATGRRVALSDQSNRTRLIFEEKVFDLAIHPTEPLIAVRTLADVNIIDMRTLEITHSVATGRGLPRIAWSLDGTKVASLEHDGVVLYSLRLENVHRLNLEGDAHPVGLRAANGSWLLGLSDGNLVQWRRG
jgi:WD40 repeat protein